MGHVDHVLSSIKHMFYITGNNSILSFLALFSKLKTAWTTITIIMIMTMIIQARKFGANSSSHIRILHFYICSEFLGTRLPQLTWKPHLSFKGAWNKPVQGTPIVLMAQVLCSSCQKTLVSTLLEVSRFHRLFCSLSCVVFVHQFPCFWLCLGPRKAALIYLGATIPVTYGIHPF